MRTMKLTTAALATTLIASPALSDTKTVNIPVECKGWTMDDFASRGFIPMFLGIGAGGAVTAFTNGKKVALMFVTEADPTKCVVEFNDIIFFDPNAKSAQGG